MLRNCAIAGQPRSPEDWLDNAFDEFGALLPLRLAFTDFTIRGSFCAQMISTGAEQSGSSLSTRSIRELTEAAHQPRIEPGRNHLLYPDRSVRLNSPKRQLRALFHESDW
jgi:hypothetical protein